MKMKVSNMCFKINSTARAIMTNFLHFQSLFLRIHEYNSICQKQWKACVVKIVDFKPQFVLKLHRFSILYHAEMFS